ncbi:MAG: hypothetical protein WDO71_03540 [Bacteroidota bacterium]
MKSGITGFYGLLASDERTHAWMDEGINSYYDALYSLKKDHHFSQQTEQTLLETFIAEKRDQPVETPSEVFSEPNYYAVAYYKHHNGWPGCIAILGQVILIKLCRSIIAQWQFKHPQPEDSEKVMEEVSGKDLDSAFSLLKQKGNLPGWKEKARLSGIR